MKPLSPWVECPECYGDGRLCESCGATEWECTCEPAQQSIAPCWCCRGECGAVVACVVHGRVDTSAREVNRG